MQNNTVHTYSRKAADGLSGNGDGERWMRRMKQLAICSNLIESDMLRALLDMNGIRCQIANENDATIQGGTIAVGVPFQSWNPQIWVDDADFEKASKLLKEN